MEKRSLLTGGQLKFVSSIFEYTEKTAA